MVFDDKGIVASATDKVRPSRFPDHWLKQMVVPDFDVGRRRCTRCSSEQDVFTRGFKEIVGDLVGTAGSVAATTIDGLCVGAGASHGNAMEIGEIGIHHG